MELRINNQPIDDLTLEASGFAEWMPLEVSCPPLAEALHATLVIGGEQLGPPTTSPFDPIWRWRWIPRGVAGLVHGELQVTDRSGSLAVQGFKLRLQPRLIDQQTWAALLADVARLARGLAVVLGGAAFAEAVLLPLPDAERTPLEEALTLLERHSADLEQVVGALAERPETTLHSTISDEPLSTITTPAPDALSRPPAALDFADPVDETPALREIRRAFRGATPRTLPMRRSLITTDLPEHRWIVGLIDQVQRRLRIIRHLAETESQRSDLTPRTQQALNALPGRIERRLSSLRRLRATPLLAGLPSSATPPAQSQRLVRDQRYRPLRRIWRELRAAPILALYAPTLALPIADLPTLYEQWVALSVMEQVLMFDGTVVSQHLLQADTQRDQWTLSLTSSAPLLELKHGLHLWRLRYQPRYDSRPDALGLRSLDGYTRIPDVVLEIVTPEQPPRLLVFDAKYRRAPDGRVPQDALDDAYAYQGALGQAGASAVQKAAIVYPGTHMADYGAVASLPLLPGQTAALRQWLAALLSNQQIASYDD